MLGFVEYFLFLGLYVCRVWDRRLGFYLIRGVEIGIFKRFVVVVFV